MLRPPSRRRRPARRGRRRRHRGRRPRTGAGPLRSWGLLWCGRCSSMSTRMHVGGAGPHRENSPSTVDTVHPTVTRVEIAALLAVAQDHAFGQPAGSQLRATVLGQHLAAAAGVDAAERATTWWTSALRFLGCTGHAHEVAVVFGDEIELRSRSLRADSANPTEFLRLSLTHAGSDRVGVDRLRAVLSVLAGGKKAAEMNFRTACEVADVFAKRLGLDERCAWRSLRTSSAGTAAGFPTAPREPRSHDPCGSPRSARSSRCSPASKASTRRRHHRSQAWQGL